MWEIIGHAGAPGEQENCGNREAFLIFEYFYGCCRGSILQIDWPLLPQGADVSLGWSQLAY